MALKIMQGDSYPVFLYLEQDGKPLTPDMVENLEVCVGEIWRFTLAEQTLAYDYNSKQWYFWPTQEDTISVEGNYNVYARPKYANDPAEVYTYKVDRLTVMQSDCKEVL